MVRKFQWELIALLIVPVVGVPLLWHFFHAQQSAQRQSACIGRMCVIGTALHGYDAAHNRLPPPYVLGPDGRRWHSWRLLLLKSSGLSTSEDFRDYRFDEPWDGPNNRILAARPTPSMYACPADPEGRARGMTSYFVVVGPDTAFPGTRPVQLSNITRPLGETILVVEAAGQGIHWMEPRDLSLDDMSFVLNDAGSPSVSSRHKHPSVFFADGSHLDLTRVAPLDLRAMFLIRPEAR